MTSVTDMSETIETKSVESAVPTDTPGKGTEISSGQPSATPSSVLEANDVKSSNDKRPVGPLAVVPNDAENTLSGQKAWETGAGETIVSKTETVVVPEMVVAEVFAPTKPKQGDKSSNLIGVAWSEKEQMWIASCPSNGLNIIVGLYRTEEEAGLAVDLNRYLTLGVKAKLNFGIPKQFVRANGNVLFVPGPNKWFLRFKVNGESVAIGYFQNADSADAAYAVAGHSYMTRGADGLNEFRSFLFEKCFEETALAPWSTYHDENMRGSDPRSHGNHSVGEQAVQQMCMLCCVRPPIFVTNPCEHISMCASCRNQCVSTYMETKRVGPQSVGSQSVGGNSKTSFSTASPQSDEYMDRLAFLCPICKQVCALTKDNRNDVSLAQSEGPLQANAKNVAEMRAPVFRFPRFLQRMANGSFVVSVEDCAYKVPNPTKSTQNNGQIRMSRHVSLSTTGRYVTAPTRKIRLQAEQQKKKKKKRGRKRKTNSSITHQTQSRRRSLEQSANSDNGADCPRVFTSKSACVRSAYRGVCWDTRKQKWKAQIGHQGETLYLGHHDKETEAALAYDTAARRLHKGRAKTNFDTLGFRTGNSGNTSMGSGYTKPKNETTPLSLARTLQSMHSATPFADHTSGSRSKTTVANVTPSLAQYDDVNNAESLGCATMYTDVPIVDAMMMPRSTQARGGFVA